MRTVYGKHYVLIIDYQAMSITTNIVSANPTLGEVF